MVEKQGGKRERKGKKQDTDFMSLKKAYVDEFVYLLDLKKNTQQQHNNPDNCRDGKDLTCQQNDFQ